jgi:hypothetical protein
MEAQAIADVQAVAPQMMMMLMLRCSVYRDPYARGQSVAIGNDFGFRDNFKVFMFM